MFKDAEKVQLRDEVFCNYDSLERPVEDHKEVINVTIQLLLKSTDYDEHSAGLTLNYWTTLTWIDGILNWKPEEHDNIQTLIVHSDYLWKPDLSVYNRVEQSGSAAILDSDHCIVKYTGQISCVSPSNHEILCQPNLKYFPFDTQICTMVIGSWIHEGEEVNIHTPKVPVSLSDYSETGEWKLNTVNITYTSGKYDCCPNSTFPYVEYTFSIERQSGIHVCVAIVPAISMFVMSIISFFMDIKGQERNMITVANIIVHLLFIQFYAWSLPVSGPDPPLLMTYSRDSLIMATFMLILTTILRKLILCRMDSPKWIGTATGYAMNSRAVQLVFMFDGSLKDVAERLGDDDGRNIIENVQSASSSTNNDWLVLAKLLDRVALIAYFIVYFIMCIAFIP
ncbi:neuronal acetylcholine receptor subunit alpha-9-like [Atheta coriaria]|uniref:neuronal acetylcholine receptor subunit alpha-9-like n=1 Tax=Dalotia coriaria TaxID=877792 RepID=UPI0031F3A365